ncbi:glycosyltransferase family A protein [Nocardioides renjunii]|uniref:glycosyltransferase family A protein n=1 Tax=Nocardioides renjunii TaxID=3095075 RepID=UPI002AFEE3B0|nr:glycosyltransferase family A protein [Nocardioides sp. S-34]WQQ22162.1 glycosyltransferase family A protein [Nocardioides sp. S-34]
MPPPVVTLRLHDVGREDRLRAWVEALGRVDGFARNLRTDALTSPEVLDVWCADAGVGPVVLGEPPASDVVVIARADDLPTPGALHRLVAATHASGVTHETRVLPCRESDQGPHQEPARAPSACAAFPAAAIDGVPWHAGPDETVDSLRARGADVRRLATAAVFVDAWPGRTAVPLQDGGDGSVPPYGHPAAVPTTSLHQLLVETGIVPPALAQNRGPRPLLTVLTRTQGARLLCLEETLTCLAGQSVRDFEVVVACHRASVEGSARVRRLVSAMPAWLRERIRVLDVDRPGRSAPLNDALDVATGRFAVMLDDDDVVTTDWVAAFAEAEARGPGTVLRSAALAQDVSPYVDDRADGPAPLEVGPARRVWPDEFSLVDHLWDNASPPMTFAVPRGVFDDLGVRFAETLDTTEDWDFLLRAASVAGATSTPAVTAVYRVWTEGEGSRHLHDSDTWTAGRQAVVDAADQRLALLPRGEARAVRALHQALLDERAEKFRFAGLNEQAAKDLVTVNEAVVALRARIAVLEERLKNQRRRRQ